MLHEIRSVDDSGGRRISVDDSGGRIRPGRSCLVSSPDTWTRPVTIPYAPIYKSRSASNALLYTTMEK